MNVCLLIPIYDHPRQIRGVVESLARFGFPCLIVDDGSGAETRAALAKLSAEHDWIDVHSLPRNRGKGAALKAGYRLAAARGFTHAIQLDADGQHDADDVPRFVEAMRLSPEALVLGQPRFDETVPAHRLAFRQLSRGLVWLASLSFAVADPLCGFRGVPLAAVLGLLDTDGLRTGNRMEFEPELCVRAGWAGIAIRNLGTRVIYPPDGISHFDVVRDDLLLAGLYVRLVLGMLVRAPALLRREPVDGGGWAQRRERGGTGWMRAITALFRVLGRPIAKLGLYPTVFFFFLFDRSTRDASRDYLDTLYASPEGRAALGHRPGARDVFRHIHAFATSIFDRMVVWSGGVDRVEFEHRGSEYLFELAAAGRGALLIGSHLGSFDLMRLLAGQHDLVVNVVMFTRHAERINEFLASLDPTHRVRVIQIDPGSIASAFEIRECIARGEFVGILADRVDPGGRARPERVSFLGRTAEFPLAPFVLATVLGCPALSATCVRVGDARYEAVVKPLGDTRVPRAERQKRARELLAAYVGVLESTCLRTPYEWFNFYPYWRGETDV